MRTTHLLSTIIRTAARPSIINSQSLSPLLVRPALIPKSHSSRSRIVQRGLDNCFAHDLIPAPSVIEAALRASRRVNDSATAVRIFEGIKEKVKNKVTISGLFRRGQACSGRA
ncbi:hypothetical protein AX14_000829, partial [Amanita brunnescens Koide BX004]